MTEEDEKALGVFCGNFARRTKDIDPEIESVVTDNFLDLLAE